MPVLALDLDGRVGSVRRARHATEQFFAELAAGAGPRFRDETRGDVLLVIAELVSNACRHAPGPCRLTVAPAADGTVEVAVEDTSRELLATASPPAGYGLVVVTGLCRGVHVLRMPQGKIVQATVVERRLW
ncbi:MULTISPECIES: ATP-binding protein [Kitasatospora]|uniref:Histidine kinase/HSP90-like ATPase domain-containing protein n=1 Tax=Kitasatospora cystarginea TaxID=58350 RepID=A0ABN3E817_9ACTN